MEGPVVVELVEAGVVRPIRQSVLRPGQAEELSSYPADDAPGTAHIAARTTHGAGAGCARGQAAEVLAVGTVQREAPPWEPERPDSWRVRGMATRPESRRHGLGGLVLEALLDHVVAHGGRLVWCNARLAAQQLYRRAGFMTRGQVFELPGIGPHIQMWRSLETWRPADHDVPPAPSS